MAMWLIKAIVRNAVVKLPIVDEKKLGVTKFP
jgi:hypothetical protein